MNPTRIPCEASPRAEGVEFADILSGLCRRKGAMLVVFLVTLAVCLGLIWRHPRIYAYRLVIQLPARISNDGKVVPLLSGAYIADALRAGTMNQAPGLAGKGSDASVPEGIRVEPVSDTRIDLLARATLAAASRTRNAQTRLAQAIVAFANHQAQQRLRRLDDEERAAEAQMQALQGLVAPSAEDRGTDGTFVMLQLQRAIARQQGALNALAEQRQAIMLGGFGPGAGQVPVPVGLSHASLSLVSVLLALLMGSFVGLLGVVWDRLHGSFEQRAGRVRRAGDAGV